MTTLNSTKYNNKSIKFLKKNAVTRQESPYSKLSRHLDTMHDNRNVRIYSTTNPTTAVTSGQTSRENSVQRTLRTLKFADGEKRKIVLS
jgi:hypothetical protein